VESWSKGDRTISSFFSVKTIFLLDVSGFAGVMLIGVSF